MDARKTRWILISVCIALATVVATVTSFNLALPDFAEHSGATQTQLNWSVDAYALVFSAMLLPGGSLGDIIGRRRVLLIGLGIFATICMSVIWLETPTQIISVRALLGIAAALIMPATLSTITSQFPEDKKHKAVSIWAGVAGASGVLGLLASGTLLMWFDWKSVFYASSAIAVTSLLCTYIFVPESADPTHAAKDPIGAILAAAGLFALVYAIIEAPTNGWVSHATIITSGIGIMILVLLMLWEARAARPMLDPRLFSNTRFAAGSLSIAIQFFCFFGLAFIALFYFQLIRGWSSIHTAVAMLPVPLGIIPMTKIMPRLMPKLGQIKLCTTGLLTLATGIFFLSFMNATTPYWHIAIFLFSVGLGMGLAMTPATIAITEALPPEQQGVASAINDISRELGGALGIAVLGSILNTGYRRNLNLPDNIPANAQTVFENSLAGALKVADKIGGTQGELLKAIAKEAFTTGYSHAMIAGSCVAAIGAIAVGLMLHRGTSNRRI